MLLSDTPKVTEPLEPPPVKDCPAVTPVMSPTLLVNPASLLKPEILMLLFVNFF